MRRLACRPESSCTSAPSPGLRKIDGAERLAFRFGACHYGAEGEEVEVVGLPDHAHVPAAEVACGGIDEEGGGGHIIGAQPPGQAVARTAPDGISGGALPVYGQPRNQKLLHRAGMKLFHAVVEGIVGQMAVEGGLRRRVGVKIEALGRREGILVAEHSEHTAHHAADEVVFERYVALPAYILFFAHHAPVDLYEVVPLPPVAVAFASFARFAEVGHSLPVGGGGLKGVEICSKVHLIYVFISKFNFHLYQNEASEQGRSRWRRTVGRIGLSGRGVSISCRAMCSPMARVIRISSWHPAMAPYEPLSRRS